jgi:dTDP-N-acetylfucosamine:lipid II N-acetylfucosaminyltransferase
MSQLIVHYVATDKFTSGYIFYMHKIMQDYRHIFVIDKRSIIKSNVVNAEKLFISNPWDILTNKYVRKILDECHKFIVSGVFDNAVFIPFLPHRILTKTYLHFWGGDFYCLRNKADMPFLKKKGPKSYIKRNIYFTTKRMCIRKCAAVITLIEEDYDELVKISGISKHHLVAPMPGDGSGKKAVETLDNIKKQVAPHLIQVGNSATESNRHIEALSLLEKYSDENIEIICPLSYGDKEYAKQVVDYGIKLFGTKFVPLNGFMPKDEYFALLARVEVAVFNNDRQQAMGNISKLLSMGCKVYLRNDTSMWRAYLRRGYSIHNIDKIYSEGFSAFVSFSKEEASKNKRAYLEAIDPSIGYNAWKSVFDE